MGWRTKLRLFWYNHFKRHWANFKLRRAWIAEGRDPSKWLGIGAIDRDCWEWATKAAEEVEKYKAANPDWKEKTISSEEFRVRLKGRSVENNTTAHG